MGYRTYFDTNAPSHIIEALQKEADDEWLFTDSVKWYDWEADCRKVSAAHPLTCFYVEGEGEDPGDQWRAYFLGGAMQYEKQPAWEPPPFDPAKLDWVNQQYLKTADDVRLAALVAPFLRQRDCDPDDSGPDLVRVVALLKDRATTVAELADAAVLFYRALHDARGNVMGADHTPGSDLAGV